MTADNEARAGADPVQLSIVIPTFNEEGNIEPLLRSLTSVVDGLGASYEILVIDVGSEDRTVPRAEALGAVAYQQSEPGYGGALREGFRRARGEYVVTMDADLSHDPVFIRDMWEKRREADMIIASRYVPGGRADMPALRYVLSRILNVTFTWVLALPLADISSGFRMYRRSILPGLALASRDFDILEEIIMKVYAEGYRVVEIPLAYAPRHAGRSHARLFKFAVSYARTLYSMWRLRNSVFAADYDERAYNSWILPQRYWQRERVRLILDMLKGARGSILDIGCGSSRIFQAMSGGALDVGLDIQLKKLRYLRKQGKPLVTGDIKALPFRDAAFETVVCSQVIEHIPIDARIFSELARVTREGGLLVLGTPDYGRLSWVVIEWFYGKLMPNAYADEHISHYDREGLVKIMQEAGFEVLGHSYVAGSELVVRGRRTAAAAGASMPSLALARSIGRAPARNVL